MTLFQTGASLILGGARSGKSRVAEQIVDESLRDKVYVATSELLDGEMEERVAKHRARRGPDWTLVEEPLDLPKVISDLATPQNCILVDCLTLWLSNLMMAERDVPAASAELVGTLNTLDQSCSVLLVSNEVGQGIVPIEKMARDFRDYAGALHQQLSAVVPHVWFVTAGLPQKLK